MRPFNIYSLTIPCPELFGVLFILRLILLLCVACHIFSPAKALGAYMLNSASLLSTKNAVTAVAQAFISPVALISIQHELDLPVQVTMHAPPLSFQPPLSYLIQLDMLYVSIIGLESL